MQGILFVCFGNLCRSPMAEGFFHALRRGATVSAGSAGVGARDGVPPSLLAILEMKRRGIDISHHRARNIASIDLSEYETAIAMDREVAALFRTAFPEFEDLRIWNIPDPYGGSATQYQRAAGLIRDRVEDLLRGLG